MRVERTEPKVPKTFIPVAIEITFETEKELRAFYAVFNSTKVCDAVRPYFNPEAVRDRLEGSLPFGASPYITFRCDGKLNL